MKVTLIHATDDAATLLLFTKQTRLQMSTGLMKEIANWSEEKRAEELAYMARTIRSSWEFVHLTFLVEGLSRATAQQVTRTRTASYAMQSQRVTDVRAMGVVLPSFHNEGEAAIWDAAVDHSKTAYANLVDLGVAKEDARGVLPMNSECNLVVQYNLRSFVDVVAARRSLRAQGEYRTMVMDMAGAALDAWPWAEPFFEDPHATAIKMLEGAVKDIGLTTGTGPGWEIAKAIDLLRKA